MTDSPSPTAVGEDVKHAMQGLTAKGKEAVRRNRTKVGIDEKMIQAEILRLNNEFGVLNYQDGDTLVYIGPPPQAMSERQTRGYTYNQNHFSIPHRVHRSNFSSLNSKKFNELFGTRSIRTERRLRKERILSRISTDGIKYFIDLQPPTEDDEAVFLLTSLTCTKGVLTWHAARDKYGLSPLMVEGQDNSSIETDFYLSIDPPTGKKGPQEHKSPNSEQTCSAKKAPRDKEQADSCEAPHVEDSNESETEMNDTGLQFAIASSFEPPENKPNSPNVSVGSSSKPALKQSGKPPAILAEYSPLRHRSAIERLVQAIENADPRLDSAPKVWTFFAVAKYFDCASHERISRWITRWLLSYPNCNFIQSNPEVALRIGLGTQSENITKDTFSILAGEKSLLNVFGELCPTVLSPLVQSVHGRKLELLDDDERNRIDHAAASLVRRMRQRFDRLIGEEMAWLHQSSSYRKIFALGPYSPEEADVVEKLSQKVKQFVRERITSVLNASYHYDFSEFEQALHQVRPFYPGAKATFRETYNKLDEKQRIFTRFFWTALNQENLEDNARSTWVDHSRPDQPPTQSHQRYQSIADRITPSREEKKMRQSVTKEEVVTLLWRFNEIEWRRSGQDVCLTTPVGPATHEISSQPGPILDPAEQENPSSLASKGSGGFRNMFKNLCDRSSKREQPPNPPGLLKDKRRKLSDADVDMGQVMAPHSGLELLPIFSREKDFSKRDEELLQSSHGPVQDACPETAVKPTLLAPSCNDPIEARASREKIVPLSLESYVSPISSSKTQSGAGPFWYGDSQAPNFQPNIPILPKPPVGGLAVKEATYPHHVADMLLRRTFGPNNHANQPPVAMSDGCGADSDRVNQRWQGAGADSLYDKDDGKSRPVVIAADLPLREGDVNWTEDAAVQQVSGHGSSQSTHGWTEGLVYSDLFHDISLVLHRICDEIINPAHLFHGDHVLPTNLIDTLMCLNEDEWKYLPLWAGGNDDGTGGVFDEVDVPNLEAGGFQGGKRGIGSVRNGGGGSNVSESSFDDIGSDAISTVGKASKAATDGTQTVRSLSDIGSEDEGFMKQNELWDEIRNVKIEEAGLAGQGTGTGVAKGKTRDEDMDYGIDDDMDGGSTDGVDTVVAAGSVDGDDCTMDEAMSPGVSALDDEGTDDDLDIIDADDL